jgi:hypothetical protein
MFITGVNGTGDKLFSGVNDTGEKFIAGVVDTGEQFICQIQYSKCYHQIQYVGGNICSTIKTVLVF